MTRGPDPLRVVLEELPSTGLELDFDLEDRWASRAVAAVAGGPVLALSGHLALRRVGPGYAVEGRVSLLVRRRCDRCLSELDLSLDFPLSLYYESEPAFPPAEHQLEADELDVGFLEGGELDLGAVLAEQVALELPPRVLCELPGAHRLEEGPCELPGRSSSGEPDSPFAVLATLRLEEPEG